MKTERRLQPYLFWILLAFLTIGFFVPIIGIIALVCMLAPIVIAPSSGRTWCGNYCPRGSFYDSLLGRLSPHKNIPPFFQHKLFRLFMIGMIFTVFFVQTYFAWGDLAAVGLVFIRLIVVTTMVGILLGFFFHERTWCSFCPMGTMASWLSAGKKPMLVSNSCVSCKLCSKACPFQLKPYEAKGDSTGYADADCLKCGKCVASCPMQAIK